MMILVMMSLLMMPACPATCPGQTRPCRASTLRVATYNIHSAKDPELILENLKRLDADVIFLQEAPLLEKGVVEFARKLGMNFLFAPYRPGGNTGCAILSRGALKLVRPLKSAQPGERDFGLIAELTAGGSTINVVCIHLKSVPRPLVKGFVSSVGLRSAQAREVAEFAVAAAGPVIVAGDCNTLAPSPDYRLLAGVLTDCCVATKTATQPSIYLEDLGLRIDHVFVNEAWRVQSCRVLPLAGSDHRPVVAELERIKKASQASTTTQPDP
jgi:endonuclease/exonuclease/phosphatase (EEP) superfamily protein YafD